MARPATDVRLRILAAARAAFEADGFDATSLRAIARGARTTIGMIYYYFPTKDALWDAVIDAVYQPFVAASSRRARSSAARSRGATARARATRCAAASSSPAVI
jgi:AcrR family transcriptional regulator